MAYQQLGEWTHEENSWVYTVQLFEEHVCLIEKVGLSEAKNKILSFKECLNREEPLNGKSDLDAMLMKRIVQMIPKEEILTKSEQKVVKFWKAFDETKLKKRKFKPTIGHSFLELSSPKAVHYYGATRNAYSREEAFDILFFHGSKVVAMDLKARKTLQKILFDALAPNSGLSLSDAFPLFDYNKLEAYHFEIKNRGHFISEAIWLSPKGFISLGSEEYDCGGRIGGSQAFSLEYKWRFRERLLKEQDFPTSYQKIFSILEQAIIRT